MAGEKPLVSLLTHRLSSVDIIGQVVEDIWAIVYLSGRAISVGSVAGSEFALYSDLIDSDVKM